MQSAKLSEREIRTMSQLKGTEIEAILLREMADSQLATMTAKDDVIMRWHQGRQQLLFEMIEIINTARDVIKKRDSQRKPDRNEF